MQQTSLSTSHVQLVVRQYLSNGRVTVSGFMLMSDVHLHICYSDSSILQLLLMCNLFTVACSNSADVISSHYCCKNIIDLSRNYGRPM